LLAHRLGMIEAFGGAFGSPNSPSQSFLQATLAAAGSHLCAWLYGRSGLAAFGLLGVFISPLAMAITLLSALRSQARVGLLAAVIADATNEKKNS
jgi:uncharacterized membrane protein (DUF4010 family)